MRIRKAVKALNRYCISLENIWPEMGGGIKQGCEKGGGGGKVRLEAEKRNK